MIPLVLILRVRLSSISSTLFILCVVMSSTATDSLPRVVASTLVASTCCVVALIGESCDAEICDFVTCDDLETVRTGEIVTNQSVRYVWKSTNNSGDSTTSIFLFTSTTTL